MKKPIKCETIAFQGDISLIDLSPLGIKKIKQLVEMGCIKVKHQLNSLDREAYGYHPSKGLVLAQGESRQHFHAFRNIECVDMYEQPAIASNDNKKRLFIVIKKTSQILKHEEHDPIEFKPSIYELFYQSEYTFEGEYRRVAD